MGLGNRIFMKTEMGMTTESVVQGLRDWPPRPRKLISVSVSRRYVRRHPPSAVLPRAPSLTPPMPGLSGNEKAAGHDFFPSSPPAFFTVKVPCV